MEGGQCLAPGFCRHTCPSGCLFLSSTLLGTRGTQKKWVLKKHLAGCSPDPREPAGSEKGRFCSPEGPGRAGGGAGSFGPRGQIQAQQRVEQSSLAGGPALPAFLLALGSSRTKDMARAQW